MLRVNFSIIIIAMTRPAMVSEKLLGNATENGSDDDSFNWSKTDQGLLLSAYFYGYIFPNLLGGFLADKFGGRLVIFSGMFLSAIVTGLSPFAASDNFVFMFAARFVLGVLGVSRVAVRLLDWVLIAFRFLRAFCIQRATTSSRSGRRLRKRESSCRHCLAESSGRF